MKITLAIVGVIIIGGLAWLLLGDSSDDATTNTATKNANTVISANTNATTSSNTNTALAEPTEDSMAKETTDEMKEEADSMEYQFSGLATDVSGGTGIGEVKATFENDTYTLSATFENLPDPEGTDFYEGWIVRNSPSSVISTGVAEKENGVYTNMYSSGQDLTDHDFYVLTLEPDDGDPAPAAHILEGNLSL